MTAPDVHLPRDDALPILDAETAPFWHGLARRELLLKWCTACGRPHYYPRDFCPFCWSDRTEWRRATGHGTVFATTVVHQHGLEPFRSRAPYNVSIVELDEGPRLLAPVHGIAPDAVRIGTAVELDPEVHGDIGLPRFRPRTA